MAAARRNSLAETPPQSVILDLVSERSERRVSGTHAVTSEVVGTAQNASIRQAMQLVGRVSFDKLRMRTVGATAAALSLAT